MTRYDRSTPYYIPEKKPSLWYRLGQRWKFWRTTGLRLPKLWRFK